jgi:hypothetical protein
VVIAQVVINPTNITIIDKNTKIIIRIDKYNTSGTWLVLWCLTPLLTILMEETVLLFGIDFMFHWQRARDRMVVGITTTYATSAYHQ